MPGNFGVRLLDQMQTNITDFHKERLVSTLGFSYMPGDHLKNIPELMPKPLDIDYPSDEESDNEEFDMKIPELEDLLMKFEKDDDVIQKESEAQKSHFAELKIQGWEK